MCEDPNLDPDAEMYSCEWSTAAISQTYTLHVAAVNCGDQVGPDSIPVTVSLQGIYHIQNKLLAVYIIIIPSQSLSSTQQTCPYSVSSLQFYRRTVKD